MPDLLPELKIPSSQIIAGRGCHRNRLFSSSSGGEKNRNNEFFAGDRQ
jgi:hypothetical protein